mgnify:CR=1 FL=1
MLDDLKLETGSLVSFSGIYKTATDAYSATDSAKALGECDIFV